jgi:arsenate reductase (glutaredoxin)
MAGTNGRYESVNNVNQYVTIMKIYHNPRCKKSREGLQFIRDKGLNVQVIDYIKNPISEKELQEIVMKLGKKPVEIVRTQEEYFKKNLKGRNFTDEEWITILMENPRLIQRPIVVEKHKAVIAQPPEKINQLL